VAIHYLSLILVGMLGCQEPEPGSTAPPPPGAEPEAHVPGPKHVHVGETLQLDAQGSVGTQFVWTTSDGQSAEGAVVELQFDAPGHLTAILSVSDELGRSDTASVPISVTWPPSTEPPRSSSALAADGDRLYAVMPDFDLLVEIDLAARAVLRWVPVCDEPRTVASAHGALWVACAGDTVARVAEQTELVTLPQGSRPFGIVPWAGGVWVTLQGAGALAELGTEGALLRVVPALPDARGLAAWGAEVMLSRWRSPDEGGLVLQLDEALSVQHTTTLPLDPGPDSDTNSRGVPNLLAALSVRPDGRVAVVGGTKANLERGLFRDGLPLTFETASRADLREISLHPDEGTVGEQTRAALFDDRDQVLAVAWSPRGDWLYVLSPGMETVDVLDAYTLKVSGAAQGTGSGAEALWVSPEGDELWVLASASRTLTVFDLTQPATPSPLVTLELLPPEGEILDEAVLAGKILFGRSVDPRMSGGGYLSCASCHPEGDHDGRTWDFTDRGEGLRNTISLLGRAGVGPLHWSANFDEIQDFENDIRYGQGGQGFLTEELFAQTEDTLGPSKQGLSPELDALAAYVQSLTRAPAAAAPPPELAAQGQQLFHDPVVGCAECHALPSTTDSAWLSEGEPLLHDVGTLGPGSGQRRGGPLLGLDTPSLQGLAHTAPYLHDGSAPTVRAVLVDRNSADQHGVTSHLSEDELVALEAFLLGL
jgi:mono/diheme cytochrome c family protein